MDRIIAAGGLTVAMEAMLNHPVLKKDEISVPTKVEPDEVIQDGLTLLRRLTLDAAQGYDDPCQHEQRRYNSAKSSHSIARGGGRGAGLQLRHLRRALLFPFNCPRACATSYIAACMHARVSVIIFGNLPTADHAAHQPLLQGILGAKVAEKEDLTAFLDCMSC